MKISAHIAYYHYAEKEYSNKRYKYVVSMLNDYFNEWEVEQIDIYIHTNTEDAKIILDELISKTHIHVSFIIHDLSNENPHNLTWKHRALMETQKDDYDVFLYLEDDIGMPYKAFQYWLKYKDNLYSEGYDVGFVRVETLNNKDYFCSDVVQPCSCYLQIKDRYFTWNHQNYCAFWICDKNALSDFILSPYWKQHGLFPHGLDKPEAHFIRESAAIGYKMYYDRMISMHPGLSSMGSMYPLDENKEYISDICFVHHLANNYINAPGFVQGKFNVKRMVENPIFT